MADGLHFARRLRRTPYTDRVEAAGVRGYTITNHMLLPKAFEPSVEDDYWHLREHVQVWDVACERQVEISGPDAARLVQWMTPRDISTAAIGHCLYVPLIDENAGMINDPVLLKLDEDRFWLSIADSDVLLYAKGIALGAKLDVRIHEPDVSPLAIQGPKAEELAVSLFGDQVRDIDFFKFDYVDFADTRQLIARSGYSRQGGFEIYLDNGALGGELWDLVMKAGDAFNIRPGCPNLIERIEGGLLSYGNEMTIENNPLQLGLERFCCLDGSIDYAGREALQKIADQGVNSRIRGVRFGGRAAPPCTNPWPVLVNDDQVGEITSAAWSPRLKRNVGLAMVARDFWEPGQHVMVETPSGPDFGGEICNLPFE